MGTTDRQGRREDAGAQAPSTSAANGDAQPAGDASSRLLQRKIQRRAQARVAGEQHLHETAARGVEGAGAALPHFDRIQQSFGRHDVSHVQAHTDATAAGAARAIGATAYATGDHVAFAGAPDLHTAAHEAAHVVQQTHGVQLKGGVGEEGDAYERHADAVADRVVRGESSEQLLDEVAGAGARDTTSARPVQRKMGMEMEVGRRVTKADGQRFPGDTGLIEHEYFTVVTDKRDGYSNLEFVMKAFDQLADEDDAAQEALTTRLDAMKVFYDRLYADDNHHQLDSLQGVGTEDEHPFKLTPKDAEHPEQGNWGDARIAPTVGGHLPADDAGDNKGKCFCHFTVGFPIQKMYQAMQYLGGTENDQAQTPRAYAARAQATQAVAFADAVAQQGFVTGAALDAGQIAQLKGALVLLYTQVAAFAIKLRGGPEGGEKPGQIKNMTPVLSRVPLREVYELLTDGVKTVLRVNHEAILDALANRLDGTADVNDDDQRQLDGLQAVTLGNYAKSATGNYPSVSQQRVFGGMFERGVDNDDGNNLIPVEIRSFRKQLMTFDEVRVAARDLMMESRRLIHPPQPPQPLQAAQGPAAGQQPAPLQMPPPVPLQVPQLVVPAPQAAQGPPHGGAMQPPVQQQGALQLELQMFAAALAQIGPGLQEAIQQARHAPEPSAKRHKGNPE